MRMCRGELSICCQSQLGRTHEQYLNGSYVGQDQHIRLTAPAVPITSIVMQRMTRSDISLRDMQPQGLNSFATTISGSNWKTFGSEGSIVAFTQWVLGKPKVSTRVKFGMKRLGAEG